MRRLLIVAAVAAAMLGGMCVPPAGALVIHVELAEGEASGGPGVAYLLTQPSVPGSHGVVQYTDATGATNNITVTNNGPYPRAKVTDPGIVIVGAWPGSVNQNCSSGYGAATCNFAVFLTVNAGAGDDTVRVQSTGLTVSVDCGDGTDEAVVPADYPLFRLYNCEVVTVA